MFLINKIVQFRAYRDEDYYIHRIEKALGFKLYKWQRDYILDKGPIPTYVLRGRGNGKTVAVMTKFILNYKGKPIDILHPRYIELVKQELKDDPDIGIVKNRWFINELCKTYYTLLKKSRLKLREIRVKMYMK